MRYAETNGFERDGNKPNIWRYRDWVVDALNEDAPTTSSCASRWQGTSWLPTTLTRWSQRASCGWGSGTTSPPRAASRHFHDVLDDIVRTTSKAFLASTLGCARCHDHKGDPIDQTDYYSFMAFFEA